MSPVACKIVIGLPSTPGELTDYAIDPRGHDLLTSSELTIQQYRVQVMAPLARMLPIWRSQGARIYAGATLATLASALRDGIGGVTADAARRSRRHARSGSRSILCIWVALVIVMFLLTAAFAFYHRDRIEIVTGTVLGGSGSMVYLLAQLRSVHTKLVSTQIMLALLPNLPPEQWTKVSMVLLDELLRADRPMAGKAAPAANG